MPAIIVIWAIAMYLVFQALVQGAFGDEAITFTAYESIPAGDFRDPVNLFLDNLTAVMLSW